MERFNGVNALSPSVRSKSIFDSDWLLIIISIFIVISLIVIFIPKKSENMTIPDIIPPSREEHIQGVKNAGKNPVGLNPQFPSRFINAYNPIQQGMTLEQIEECGKYNLS
jgi:hypothetical protein